MQIGYRTALWIGMAQVCSLIPGVSRSGATIMGALLAGVGRPAAAEFSFLLAIPVMFAATGLDLWENRHLLSGSDALIFVTGFVVAFASARSEEHTSELQSPCNLVCRLLLEKKKNI